MILTITKRVTMLGYSDGSFWPMVHAKKQVKELEEENARLRAENKQLKAEIEELKKNNTSGGTGGI
jgi:cell division protein FtsB